MNLPWKKKAEPTEEEKRWAELRQEIWEVRQQIDCVDSCFNMIGNSDLMDSLIYQRSGLVMRYEHLIRQAKALGVTSHRIHISA